MELTKLIKKIVSRHASRSLRKTSKQISVESSNSRNEQGKLLSRKSFPVPRGENKTDVVEREPIFVKWEVPKNLSARNDNSDRCIKLRLVVVCQRVTARGQRSVEEKSKPKCIGVNFGKICNLEIHSREISKSHTRANRQCKSTDLPTENAAKNLWTQQGSLGLFDTQSDHNYNQISTKYFVLSSRLAVQKSPLRVQRVEIRLKTFFANFESPKSSSDRSLCVALKPPTAKVHFLASRSGELCSRLPVTVLAKTFGLFIPSILSDRKSTRKEKSSFIDHKTMANTAVVQDIVVNVGDTFSFVTQTQNIVVQSSRPHSSFSSKRPAAISGLKGFRRTLTSKAISGVAVTFITDARRHCSVSNYQLVWGVWSYIVLSIVIDQLYQPIMSQ